MSPLIVGVALDWFLASGKRTEERLRQLVVTLATSYGITDHDEIASTVKRAVETVLPHQWEELPMMRTCTVMVMTDGTRSVYSVMRGKMKGRYFDAHSAETLANYEIEATGKAHVVGQNEMTMTARHATDDAPPVPWQVGTWQKRTLL